MMRKYMRKVFVLLVVFGLFFAFSISVSATSSQGGKLNNIKVNGSVMIDDHGASAQTYMSYFPESSSTTVKLTYTYINTETNETTTITQIATGSNVAHVRLVKPDEPHYESLQATATHYASYEGQRWTTYTEDETELFLEQYFPEAH